MNFEMEDGLTLVVALAGAVVTWVVLASFGIAAQLAGALVAFVIVARAVR